MSAFPRPVLALAIQAALVAFAVYVAVEPTAIVGSRTGQAGVVVLSVVCALLVGEVVRVRAHMAALLQILQSGIANASPRDDRSAVDVLVKALASTDPDVRSKAHKNLVRLTGQDIPEDAEAWNRWWTAARGTYPRRREDA